MHVIAVASQKGGVGKTTISLNLGLALGRAGNRALILELDAQGSLGLSLGLADRARPGVAELLTGAERLESVLLRTREPQLQVLTVGRVDPTTVAGFEDALARGPVLPSVLARLSPDFDIVVVDCPAGLGKVTTRALEVATHALLPLQAEPLALRSIGQLLAVIDPPDDREDGTRVEFDNRGYLEQAAASKVAVKDRISHEELEQIGKSFISKTLAGLVTGDWKQALASLDGESATFSLSYRAEPPDGAIVRAAVHQGGIDAPCSLYSGSETTKGDFWYLSVTANSARSGAFNIVPQMSGGDGLPEHRDSALVRLIDVRGWEKRRVYTALSGTVTLADAPVDLEEWAEGRPMVMDISASFPDQPMQSLGCSGGGSGDGSMSVHRCECGREDGTTVTCTPDVPGQDCCLRDAGSGAGSQVRLSAVAQQCPDMCSFTDPGLARHCRALKDSN